MRYISIELDDTLYTIIERHARSKGLRVSPWCRFALLEALPGSDKAIKPVKQSRADYISGRVAQWMMMPTIEDVERDPDFILLPKAKKAAVRSAFARIV